MSCVNAGLRWIKLGLHADFLVERDAPAFLDERFFWLLSFRLLLDLLGMRGRGGGPRTRLRASSCRRRLPGPGFGHLRKNVSPVIIFFCIILYTLFLRSGFNLVQRIFFRGGAKKDMVGGKGGGHFSLSKANMENWHFITTFTPYIHTYFLKLEAKSDASSQCFGQLSHTRIVAPSSASGRGS